MPIVLSAHRSVYCSAQWERERERERETGGPERDGNSSLEWITTTINNITITNNMMEERTTICSRKMTGIGICCLTPPGRNNSERYAL